MIPHPLRRLGLFVVLSAGLAASPAWARAPVAGFDPELVHQDPDGSSYLSVRDADGIFDAMEHGDEPALQAIKTRLAEASLGSSSRTDAYKTGLCDMAIARVHGDLDGADAILDRMSRNLGPNGDPERSLNPYDFMIDLTRSGNLLLRGDARGWAESQERLQRQYFEPLRSFYRMPGLTFRNAELVHLSVPAASIPAQSVSASRLDTVAFTRWTSFIDGKPLIRVAGDVVIDGDRMSAVFDTDGTMSTLPQAYATAHRLRVVAHTGVMSDGSGRLFAQDIVLVPRIAIGGTVITNQIFTVAPVTQPILGLEQLGRLRHVTIEAKRMSFGIAAPFPCSDPLTISSLRGGYTASLLIPLGLDGQTMNARFATGDDSPEAVILHTSDLPDRLKKHLVDEAVETIGGKSLQKVATDKARLTIGQVTMNDTVKYVVHQAALEPVISTHALHYGALRFDLSEHKACFD